MTEFLERLNSRSGRRALFFLFFLSALIFSIVPLINLAAGRGAKDYKLWYTIGQTVRHGGAIYPPPHERWQNDDQTYSNLHINSSPEALAAYRTGVANPYWLGNLILSPKAVAK